MPQTRRPTTHSLYSELIRLRDEDRNRRVRGLTVVKGSLLSWEKNPQGIMKWYLHPSKEDTAIQSLLIFLQEIPPGSKSGIQKYQGGVVIYILEGRGYTNIDGEKYAWEAGDVVQLPLRPKGIVYQHVNTDRQSPVRFIACEPNYVHALGVDRGSGFEQILPSPDYPRDGTREMRRGEDRPGSRTPRARRRPAGGPRSQRGRPVRRGRRK